MPKKSAEQKDAAAKRTLPARASGGKVPDGSGTAGQAGEDAASSAPATPEATGLGLTERRRYVRKLPIPDARESDRDSDWAAFRETPPPSKD